MTSLFLIAALALTGCETKAGAPAAPLSTAALEQTIGAGGKPTLVFFLNPEGGPCQVQNGILEKLYAERGGNFNVAYVNALKQEDQKAFYDYGVRNLPSMVLVDSAGRIARVFAPGIQGPEAVTAALNSTK
jgi:thioredoxin 1